MKILNWNITNIETHKQALIISNKQEQDALYLQNMLRFSNWNVKKNFDFILAKF